MKILKVGKFWCNMDNFTNAVDQETVLTIFFGEEDYIKLTDENVQISRDWLNEAHVKTEL